jgi:hypothetical protein
LPAIGEEEERYVGAGVRDHVSSLHVVQSPALRTQEGDSI